MKIRVEISPLASKYPSGVARYTELLTNAFIDRPQTTTFGHFFNFLNRQPRPPLSKLKHIEVNRYFPLRLYAKTQSYNIALPFDTFLPSVDLTIFPNFATWPTAKSKRTAVVIHDLTYLYFPEVVENKNLAHLRRVIPRSIKKADFIITVSESIKLELIKEFNLSPNSCVVTPVPPDEVFFSKISGSKIVSVKKKYNLDLNKKYIYFIGNLEPRKNLITLIKAYRLLPKEIKKEYSLVLAGGRGWKTEATQEAIKNAVDAGEDVKHLGFIDQEDSPTLYQGASLFVIPSLYEGFGMPILEAMASGTPVIASDIPVLREVGDKYAIYADPKNPESFKDAIIATLASPKPSRATLQKNVRRYSWTDNVDKIINKVRSLE